MCSVNGQDEIRAALAQFQKIGHFKGYVLLNYDSKTSVKLAETSVDGTPEQLASKFDDGAIQYCVVRILDQNKDGHDTARDVFITWIGSKVGILEKGKKATHIGDVRKALEPFHAELTAVNKANFSIATIKDRSDPLSGSHVVD